MWLFLKIIQINMEWGLFILLNTAMRDSARDQKLAHMKAIMHIIYQYVTDCTLD